jgi:hypothetical protein
MKREEFIALTANFHTKVQEKLRERNWPAPVQVMRSGKPNTQLIIVGMDAYEVYNDGNLAEWRYVGEYR